MQATDKLNDLPMLFTLDYFGLTPVLSWEYVLKLNWSQICNKISKVRLRKETTVITAVYVHQRSARGATQSSKAQKPTIYMYITLIWKKSFLTCKMNYDP